MVSISLVILVGAVLSFVSPSVADGFILTAWYTNFPGLIAPINANGGSFWLKKPTNSYCPSEVVPNCPIGNTTSFVGGTTYGTLSLNTIVPGGQQVYISPNGLLSYTQAHSAYIPPGSVTSGLVVNATTAQVNKFYPFWLCNLDSNSQVWQVWSEYEDENGSVRIGGKTPTNACTRFILKATPVNGTGAWQYD